MKRFLLAAMMALALAVPASGQSSSEGAPRTNAAGQVRLTDQVRPLRYDMVVTPNAEALTLAGDVTIEIVVLSPQEELVVNALDMEFGAITLDGRRATTHWMFAAELQQQAAAQRAAAITGMAIWKPTRNDAAVVCSASCAASPRRGGAQAPAEWRVARCR